MAAPVDDKPKLTLSAYAAEQISTCVHCGLCLPACPTYRVLGSEPDSPRGRIHLIRRAMQGELEFSDDVLGHLDLCLACRGCETACPSGVKYGALIEETRAHLETWRPRSTKVKSLRRLFFKGLFPHPKRMKALAGAIRFTQKTGLDKLAKQKWAAALLPAGAAEMAPIFPQVTGYSSRDRLARVIPAVGERRYRVGFISGCIMDVAFADTNLNTVQLLTHQGCEVVVPPEQSCCGALQVHSGDSETAKALARQNIDAFLSTGELDAIIINAAGCGSTLKEYHHLLHDDPAYHEKAHTFVGLMKDISEFIAAIDFYPPKHPINGVATYQDACHLAHGQGIRKQPRQLLKAIPGLTLLEHADSDLCCGSAGIYNIVQPEMAAALLERKMTNIEQAGPVQMVITANPGCYMQLKLGAKTRGLNVAVRHIVDVLAEAYVGTDTAAVKGGHSHG